ncbi:hypothetical protein I6N90_19045 [Paenibacillus sp. GSMTC-2017]|uniref:hypothetical protein n=1 Tax=Paenibacillus sp. GSMTC-2017 TaxID=2794350 RepID=UPI0018D68CD6|nr:hypothetical protein [Paenibacillus sp. GSMTC-2017]MBH5319899.1 hypothetical protein [Paenibacillus sp. GSMTC-2017]
MSKPFRVMGILAVVLLLAGIWVQTVEIRKSKEMTAESNKVGIIEEDFVYRLYTEHDEYREGDKVTLIAELEYIGDRKSVTITHATTPFYYVISESSGNYVFYYAMDQPKLSTTLLKGEPLRHSYTSPGALIAEKDDKFPEKQADVPFPAGQYDVDGSAKFTIEDTDGSIEGSFEIKQELLFEVKK